MSEGRLEASSISPELRGRMEEHYNLGEMVFLDLSRAAEKSQTVIDPLNQDSQLILGDALKTVDRNASHQTDTDWLMSMVELGIPDTDILRIWDAKIKRHRANVDQATIEHEE